MGNKYKITQGDHVSVNFNGAQITLCHRARVMSEKQSIGDVWIFLDLDTKILHYVDEPCTISKIVQTE